MKRRNNYLHHFFVAGFLNEYVFHVTPFGVKTIKLTYVTLLYQGFEHLLFGMRLWSNRIYNSWLFIVD